LRDDVCVVILLVAVIAVIAVIAIIAVAVAVIAAVATRPSEQGAVSTLSLDISNTSITSLHCTNTL
jgi:hypothetical protein